MEGNLEKGGTNAFIIRTKYHDTDAVVKQYGFCDEISPDAARLSKNTIDILINDLQLIRKLTQDNGIAIPNILAINIISDNTLLLNFNEVKKIENDYCRLVIIENYCGISLKEIILKHHSTKENILSIASLIEKIINLMPQNIELDTNPANFTILENKIYFVDFMPPKVWDYQVIPDMIRNFPQIKMRNQARELRRIRRYTTTLGRLERFNYYLNIFMEQASKIQDKQT